VKKHYPVNRKTKLIFLSLSGLLLLSTTLSLAMGAMHIPIRQVCWILMEKTKLFHPDSIDPQYQAVIDIVRIPRTLTGLAVGAALGISGAAIQGIFRNPLAEPALTGISAGASLMSALVILLESGFLARLSGLPGYYILTLGAFAGGAIASTLVYRISRTDGKPNIATMLLAGIAINAMAGALTGLLSFMAADQQLRSITFWMLGSLAGATSETVIALIPAILLPVILLSMHGKKLNAFALGESQAEQLGMQPVIIKRRIIILTTLAVGASVAVAGVIGFVGLIVPHCIRLLGGVDNRYVLPASALAGGLVLTIADTLARIVIPPIELPIGVITALLGTPVFLYILIKDKKKLLH
jgi:iron complex transport system permease protein